MASDTKTRQDSMLHITIVEDEPVVARGIIKYFELQGFYTEWVDNGLKAVKEIIRNQPDIVLLDLRLPGLDGLSVLQQLKEKMEVIPAVIVTSGHGEIEDAIAAFRLGAFDFFQKPASLAELDKVIRRTEQYVNLTRKYTKTTNQLQYLKKELAGKPVAELTGQSKHIETVRETIAIVAATNDTSVLITGESGTGKEVVARMIHEQSRRSSKNFVAVNCSALTESLFESELFGHVKGSFTGAISNRTGYFEYADEGTLLLDEIGELTPAIQAKLLRVLETRTFSKVGSTKLQSVNIRIIASTNQNLEEMLIKGTFRRDLFYRLNTIQIQLEPLRTRVEDIPLLTNYFIEKFSAMQEFRTGKATPEAYEYLMTQPLLGNVRELRNLIERACILARDGLVKPAHFKAFAAETETSADPGPTGLTLDETEKRTITIALATTSNRRAATARLLGITPQSLDRKLIKHRLTHLLKNPKTD